MSPLLVCRRTLVLPLEAEGDVVAVGVAVGVAVAVGVGVGVGVAEVPNKLNKGDCVSITDTPITITTNATTPIISQRFLLEPLRFG